MNLTGPGEADEEKEYFFVTCAWFAYANMYAPANLKAYMMPPKKRKWLLKK